MNIGFLGAGKMAEAILTSILDSEMLSPWEITACDKSEERRGLMEQLYQVVVTDDPPRAVEECKILILAVKPQDLDDLLKSVKPKLTKDHLIISIVAGKTLKVIKKSAGAKPRFIRIMPNLALMAREGMCVFCTDRKATDEDKSIVMKIFGSAGAVIPLPEKHFDAVTALSGSGPAYFAYFMRAMMAAGISLGLPADAARLMAEQTMVGTGIYLQQTGRDPDEFIQAVCSPKGTTEAGMKVLNRSSVASAVERTLRATAKRSAELAK